MKKTIYKLFITMIMLATLAIGVTCHAESQYIEATGTYVLGDRDTRDVAERRAIKDAVRVATQKAGYYVESYSRTENYVLTDDEVKAIAASIIHVYDQRTEFVNNGTVCQATVYAVAKMSDIASLIDRERGTTEGGTKQRRQPKSLAEMGYEVSSSSYEVEDEQDVSSYTGIVIDCLDARGVDDLGVNRPGIESTVIKTQSGKVLLDYRTPVYRNDFEFVFAVTQYRPDVVERIAGSNPYWVHASYIAPKPRIKPSFGGTVCSGVIVIPNEAGDIIEDIQDRTGMLSAKNPPVIVIGSWTERY